MAARAGFSPAVIASEAKQSMTPQNKSGLLRRFAPRNDGRQISRFTMTRFAATLALALIGLVLLGQGAYIHAKALLA
jgi:hypothetical protein